jgi:uncharacterized protein (TIGR02246 family)
MKYFVSCFPVLVAVTCFGCQSATDRPVPNSFTAKPIAKPAAAPAAIPRPSRLVPVVIKPPSGLQLELLERRLSRVESQPTTIRPVAAALPLNQSGNAPPRRLLEPTQPASATWATDIRATLASYTAAFNRHDPVTLATHWTTDGENLDLDTGSRTVGRDAVERVFDRLFTADGTAQIDFDIEAVRPIRDDVAVVDGVSRLELAGRQPTRSRFSAVLVRHDGRWLIESVREATAPASPSVRDRLAPLAWLRGSWEDVSDGLTISIQCDWAAAGGFLIRQHLITDEPQPPGSAARTTAGIPALLPAPTSAGTDPGTVQRRTITEFIGWDQGRGEIRSWMFCSDGRTAEFSWLRSGAGWLLTHTSSPTANTEPGQLMLEQVGADELTLQLHSGIAADLLPAADFVRTARPIDGDESH